MNILAVDPGHTTGVCLVRTAPSDKGFEVLWADEIVWNDRFAYLQALINGLALGSLPEFEPPQFLVVERFRLHQGRALEQSGSDFPSSQVIGAVGAFFWLRTWDPMDQLFFQEPGCMTRIQIPDEDVHWVKGSPHKQDAYRHARYFILMNRFKIETSS